MTPSSHLRLLQLASQAFPIGGYSHSQGFEAAIEAGLVPDEAAVRQWIVDVLHHSMATYELPALNDLAAAWSVGDGAAVSVLNEGFLATRESAELRRATVQMGFSLRALLRALPELPVALLRTLEDLEEPSLPCAWSGLAAAWSIQPQDSALAYLWAWTENQVLVAMKSVPIGQASGQRVLLRVGDAIAVIAAQGTCKMSGRSNFAPGLAILSAQHETQYSRLFRS